MSHHLPFPPDEPAQVAGAAVRSSTVAVAGLRIRVVEAGEQGGASVVLLHGWGASAFNYRSVLGPLSAAGVRAIAPDLPGHGGSESALYRGAWARRAMAAWVGEFLDAVGVERCVLVGQSIGGAVALDAAAEVPSRVAALVLLAPIGFTPVRRVQLAHLARLWSPPTTPRWLVRFIVRRIYGTRGRWTEEDVIGYWEPLRRRQTVRAVLQSAREFDFTPRDPSLLHHAGIPAVIRFGELDNLIPHAAATRQARLITGADVAVLPGVGHVPAEEIPDEIAALIVRVVSEARDRAHKVER